MSHSDKATVLILHIGADRDPKRAHNYYFTNLQALEARGDVTVLQANFLEDNLDALFAAHDIDAIDTHHSRFWQKNWERYRPKLAHVQHLADKSGARMVNDLALFDWNSDKSVYLTGMHDRGLPIIPTRVVGQEDLAQIKLSQLVKQSQDGIVIKPRSGARALGIAFITREGEDFRIHQPTTPDDAIKGDRATVDNRTVNATQLDEWFAVYCSGGNSPVLVQDLIKQRREVSVVMLEGQKPYAIFRTEGATTGVAHEAFGGRNIPLGSVPESLLHFAQCAKQSMPQNIGNQYMHRIDILITPDYLGSPALLLLEVESAGPRLFVAESRQFEAFPAMLATAAHQQRAIKQGHRLETRIHSGEPLRDFAPIGDIRQLYAQLGVIEKDPDAVE